MVLAIPQTMILHGTDWLIFAVVIAIPLALAYLVVGVGTRGRS